MVSHKMNSKRKTSIRQSLNFARTWSPLKNCSPPPLNQTNKRPFPLFRDRQADGRFILSGLAALIDQTLISLAGQITLLTSPGLLKLRSIILTLSQNLKHLTSSPSDALLTRSLDYFSLFSLGSADFVKCAKDTVGKGYDYDEMKTMLGLLYSEQMGKARVSGGGVVGGQSGREKSLGVRRAYNECLIELNEALWNQ